MYKQTVLSKEYALSSELFLAEKAVPRYNNYIVKLLSKYYKGDGKVLDFGAGIGVLASIWRRSFKNGPDCLEIDHNLKGILIQRGFNCFETLDSKSLEYDYIYSSNVLEHIENDFQVLCDINKAAKVNGILALYVPAFNCIYNAYDEMAGHYRRYTKADLIFKLEKANFKIIDAFYVDSLGFFSWGIVKFTGYKKTLNLGDEKSLKIYDKYVFPISKLLDNLFFNKYFGKNLFIAAKKIA
jgi:Methyltransferase domain